MSRTETGCAVAEETAISARAAAPANARVHIDIPLNEPGKMLEAGCRGGKRTKLIRDERAKGADCREARRYPIPLMVLARLAVRIDRQGRSLGIGLLKDALLRTLQAADIAGIRAIVLHAKDDDARAFYEHFDFRPSPTDQMHLFLLLKDIKALIG
ncbi:MAG TPA: GNAT family N-acetyltransferase [Rhizomicrobium sp.]|nr:GNAT family N-acetyltransferase [Rhizomicrobium sp.]